MITPQLGTRASHGHWLWWQKTIGGQPCGNLSLTVTFSFSFSIYTMPSAGIELCYYSREDWEVSIPWESSFRDFPLTSIFVAWEHHFLISHTSSLFPHFATLRSVFPVRPLRSIYNSMDLRYIHRCRDSSVTYTRVVTTPKVYKTA